MNWHRHFRLRVLGGIVVPVNCLKSVGAECASIALVVEHGRSRHT